jgi:plasmid stability protein
VRQLITRIDDDLHQRLKDRAQEEGTSVNALVTRILDEHIVPETAKERIIRRAGERGVLVRYPKPSSPAPTAAEIEQLTAGWGRAVSEQLHHDRHRSR